jgi:cytochrome P450
LPGGGRLATLHDDVREVFWEDATFGVPYRGKLDVIMGGHPFFLGLGDGAEYRRQTAALRRMVRPADIPALAAAVEEKCEAVLAASGGRVEVVDQLVRAVTFDVLGKYFGITDPPCASLSECATRLFEFQFADARNDPSLRAEVDVFAPALRDHIQKLINARRNSGELGDDVLGRCLAAQAADDPDFSDDAIRTLLMGLVVGGPPQPPMVVPQAMEQLLRRPEALAGAQQAARASDDATLAGYVFEAMRFDPLGPALPRVALKDYVLAAGTRRATRIREGSTVLAAFSSAMFDHNRIPDPWRFNPRRLLHEYIHFGYGLHTCFGLHINRVLLPLMLKGLLKQQGLRRAHGREGQLSKRGLLAEALVLHFDS